MGNPESDVFVGLVEGDAEEDGEGDAEVDVVGVGDADDVVGVDEAVGGGLDEVAVLVGGVNVGGVEMVVGLGVVVVRSPGCTW
ncbi:MAG TPA: hypothetical protein VGB18_01760 [Candidatus Thermoplasmatota archaeon]